MAYLGFTYTNNDWYLFIDSSITSLKAALLYKSNLYPTLPTCYGNVKEEQSFIKKILEIINCESHQWLVMCDLKVLNIIMGLKSGMLNFLVFIACLIPDKVC